MLAGEGCFSVGWITATKDPVQRSTFPILHRTGYRCSDLGNLSLSYTQVTMVPGSACSVPEAGILVTAGGRNEEGELCVLVRKTELFIYTTATWNTMPSIIRIALGQNIWGIGEYFQAFLFKSRAASFIIIF